MARRMVGAHLGYASAYGGMSNGIFIKFRGIVNLRYATVPDASRCLRLQRESTLTGGAEGGSVRSIENLPISLRLDGVLYADLLLDPSTDAGHHFEPDATGAAFQLRFTDAACTKDAKVRVESTPEMRRVSIPHIPGFNLLGFLSDCNQGGYLMNRSIYYQSVFCGRPDC